MSIADTLNRLSPRQRQIAAVAGVGAAGFVLLRGRNRDAAEAEDASTATATGGLPVSFDNSAIGADQLMQFESDLVDSYGNLVDKLNDAAGRITELEERPQAATPVPHTVRNTYVLTVGGKGESPNQIAIRLRKAKQRTAAGADLTAAYLMKMNGWRGSAAAPRWPGENVRY